MKREDPVRTSWILAATIVGSGLVFLDGSIVAIALPEIQRTFSASASAVQWIVELYALALGALMLFGGALGDRIGYRRAFVIGVVLFGAASLACAFANSIAFLLVARFAQGIGGMLLAPASLAILGAHFSGDARGKAIGTWSSFSALTATIGPAVGGILIDHFGWRSVFFLNLPLTALVLYAAWKHMGESRSAKREGIDIVGATLCTFGLAALTYALIVSSTTGWRDALTLGALVAGFAALVAFAFVERTSRSPLLPVALFSSRPFVGINVATLLLYGALGAAFYELPFVMIQGHGYSATATAFSMLPFGICIVVLSRAGTALSIRCGTRFTLVAGPLLAAVGYALLGILEPNATYATSFLPGVLLIGVGMGITIAPLTTTVLDAAPARYIGAASGVNNAVSRVAGLLAVAGLGAVVWIAFNHNLDAALNALHATAAQRALVDVQRSLMAAARFSDASLQGVVVAAFRQGFRAIAYGCALLAMCAAFTNGLSVAQRRAAPEPATESV